MNNPTPLESKAPETAFTDADLPGLFQASDRAATVAQSRYVNFIRFDLSFLVLVAALGVIHPTPTYSTVVSGIRILLLMLGFVLAGMLATIRPDREWYDAREIAEASKSLAWRYLTGGSESDDKFVSDLDGLFQGKQYLAADLALRSKALPAITPQMQALRQQPLAVRADIYVQCRFNDQREWYLRKTVVNQKKESHWYYAILGCQFAAAVSALLLLHNPVPFNTIELFTILATAFLSWVQIRQHHQLAQAYGMAAHRLGLLMHKSQHITTEDDLKAFVEKSEQIMSGENSGWYTRQHRD